MVKVAVFGRRDKFLRLAEIIGVVGFVVAGHCHHCAVVKVVIPQSVHSITALFQRLHQPHVLRFVFSNDVSRPPARGLPDAFGQLNEDVIASLLRQAGIDIRDKLALA